MRSPLALAGVLLLAAATTPCRAQPGGGSCGPGSGDCCSADGTPGCDDVDCCEAVCAIDPFCCDFFWDDICVDQVCTFCPSARCCGTGGCCGDPGTGNCCTPQGTPCCDNIECCELICGFDPFCCEVAWDSICANAGKQNCFCKPPHPCVGDGDCCVPQEEPSCENFDCCAIVCSFDPFCCFEQWDALCVQGACTHCPHLCGGTPACPPPCGPQVPCPPGEICVDGTCVPKPPANDGCDTAEVLIVPPGGTASTQGIMFAATYDAVPFCGAFPSGPGIWYRVAGNGNVMTASTCNLAPFDTGISVYCGGCPAASPSTCCVPGASPGCDNPPCQVLICGLFPGCCISPWSANCAEVAAQLCPVCAGEGMCVAGADDSPGCALGTTEVSWCAAAGAEYLVLVHGPQGNSQDFFLLVSDGGVPCAPQVECPAECLFVPGVITECLGEGSFTVHVDGISSCTGGPVSFNYGFSDGAPGEEVCVEIALFDEAGAPCCTATLCTAVPDCAPRSLPCDLDGDGELGTTDMLALLAAWGATVPGPPDFDGDGLVGIADLLHLLGNWGPCA